uniref:Uncharacterized protein n=1 Tax=Anopheles atroparvus TaxID=41427 RepID=A0AAG5D2J6_ANOAO
MQEGVLMRNPCNRKCRDRKCPDQMSLPGNVHRSAVGMGE